MGTEIERLVPAVLDQVKDGSISFSDLLKAISEPAPAEKAPTALPLPAQITTAQRAALAKLTSVFGKVVPAERRILDSDEVLALYEERVALDEIQTMAEKRKESIRTTLMNSLDVSFEEADGVADSNKDGHYIANGEIPIPDSASVFRREVSETTGLDPDKLDRLRAEGRITKKDYLAMTTQTRVIDQAKVMLHLRKNPHLVTVLGDAAIPKRRRVALYIRKVK